MSYSTLPLQDCIAESSELNYEFKTYSATFGDGYEQTAAAGINNMRKKWNVNYNMLTPDKADTLMNFFKTVGGHLAFYATPRGGAEQLWKLEASSLKVTHVVVSNLTGEVYKNISFQLRKVFL